MKTINRLAAVVSAMLLVSACAASPTTQPAATTPTSDRDARFQLLSEPACPPTCTAYDLSDEVGNVSWRVNVVDNTVEDLGTLVFLHANGLVVGGGVTVTRTGDIVRVEGPADDVPSGGTGGSFLLEYDLSDDTYSLDVDTTGVPNFSLEDPNATGTAVVTEGRCFLVE